MATFLSVQPFLHRWLQSVPVRYNGTPLFPLKIAPSHRGSGPPSNTWFLGPTRIKPNGISIGPAVFEVSLVTDRQTDKPVGFYGPNAPLVPNAPSFECPQFGMCSAITGIAIGANFKIYLLRQFCSNGVEFFTIHRRHRRKNWWTEFWNSNSVIFENFF